MLPPTDHKLRYNVLYPLVNGKASIITSNWLAETPNFQSVKILFQFQKIIAHAHPNSYLFLFVVYLRLSSLRREKHVFRISGLLFTRESKRAQPLGQK